MQPPTHPGPQPVQSVRPHPSAWAEALRLAEGDVRRLRVLSATEVLVLNYPGQILPQPPVEGVGSEP